MTKIERLRTKIERLRTNIERLRLEMIEAHEEQHRRWMKFSETYVSLVDSIDSMHIRDPKIDDLYYTFLDASDSLQDGVTVHINAKRMLDWQLKKLSKIEAKP